jgi:Flp pilus assembly protein TadD
VIACLEKRPESRPTFAELAEALAEPTTRRHLRASSSASSDLNDAAAAYIALGRLGEAMSLLQELLGSGETNPAVVVNLATSASQQGMANLARSAYERALAVLGEHPTLLANFATDRFRSGDLALARSVAERALAVEPGHVGALVTLSATLNALGDHAAALVAVERAAAIDAAHPAVLYQFVYTCLLLRRCAKAKQMMNKLVSVASSVEDLQALHALGIEKCPKLFRPA